MNFVSKMLLWVAVGLLPGGFLLLPFALRRAVAAGPRIPAGDPGPRV